MLKKLFGRSRSGESSSPLASAEGLQAVIAELPIDPEHQLIEVNDWLASLVALLPNLGAPTAFRALAMLDGAIWTARNVVLERYFASGARDHSANTLLDALSAHLDQVLEAYGMLVGFRPAGKADELSDKERGYLARSGARALRAWALRKRLGRFRYRPVSELSWRYAHDVLSTMGHCGVLQSPVALYKDEPESTPFREYLLGVYHELAPLGNLEPVQQELAHQFLAVQTTFECTTQAATLSTHRIDLTANQGPQRYEEGVAAASSGAVWRYLSYARLRPTLLKLEASLRVGAELPTWLSALPMSLAQRDAGLQALLAHWAPNPPQRLSERRKHSEQLRASFGFAMARRFVAAAQFARSGRMLRYDFLDSDVMYKAYHLGDAGDPDASVAEAPDAVPEPATPLEVLQKLEVAGDRAMMESWLQIDSSSAGMGVAVPALLPRHVIGGLVVVRFVDGIEWRLGIIRRIGRNAQGKPELGLEMLAGPSFSATVRVMPGEAASWALHLDDGHGWSDAILTSEFGDEVILPAGAFTPNLHVDMRTELGLSRICLLELIETGSDYERVRFRQI